MPTQEEWAVVLFTLRVAALGTALILPLGVAAASPAGRLFAEELRSARAARVYEKYGFIVLARQ